MIKKNRKWMAMLLAAAMSLSVLSACQQREPTEPETPSEQPSQQEQPSQPEQPSAETPTIQVEQTEEMGIVLEDGLTVVEAGKYIGVFMEDGSDEIVADVLMLIVRNDGEKAVQYAEFTIPTSKGDAKFNLATLPAGESIVLLEQNRMTWSADEDYSKVTADNVAWFSEPLSLQEDKLKLQALDGVINITNISGADISEDIVLYYKNASSDLLYGGITYRLRLEGGLKADEIRQISAKHFSQSGSRIMFVTLG